MKLVFVANFDAELELTDPGYAPSTRMVAGLVERARAVAAQLGSDVIPLVPGRPRGRTSRAGTRGVCWCPTPRALRLLADCGAAAVPAPPLAILQRVNHRAFAAAIPPPLPQARFVRSVEELEGHLRSLPGDLGVVLKRAFGFAGRARKRLPRPDALTGAVHTWAQASMTAYGCGLMVEPWVEVVADFALHGMVACDGSHCFGVPTVQVNDGNGAWLRSRRAEAQDLDAAEHAELVATGHRVATDLAAAGYFGPFGLDGYRWRARDGALRFHPLSDVNARLTMGWCVGMGASAARVLVEGR